MTRFKIEPARLDSLMDVMGRKDPIWEQSELGEVLKHQMAAPLLVEERAFAGAEESKGNPAPTLASLISVPNPPIALLEKVMRVAAVRERRPGHLVPQEISTILRFACIATARVRCGQMIGDVDEEVLRKRLLELLKIPWLVPELRDLFEQTLQVTAPSKEPSTGNSLSGSRSAARSTAPQDGQPIDPAEIPQIRGYEILGRIGRGGTSTVWRARHLETNRDVALKLINASAMGPQSRRRFEREVEIAARMEHRHIARLYDSGIQGGYLFAAMELVQGVSLDRHVKQQKLNRVQILELVAVICDAVQYTHQRGVIHRDLKPANILVSEDGQPHVLDFGLAKSQLLEQQMETYSLDGTVAGTLGFMSPQQAAGQSELVDTRSDVYSLGAILYCLLTGRTPHNLSGSHIQAVRRAAEEEVTRPRSADPTLDGEIEAILLKALARDPGARYASAGAMADDLRHYLKDEPLSVRPPTLAYFLGKRIRRYRLPLGIAAAVVVCLIGTIVYSFIRISAASTIAETNAQIATEKATEAQLQEQKANANAAAAARAERLTELQLNTSLRLAGDSLASSQSYQSARKFYRKAWDGEDPGSTPLPVTTGMLLTYMDGPPPLLGPDGENPMAGGFGGHVGHVHAVAASPDGKLIATGGEDFSIRFWDTSYGREVGRVEGVQGRINALAFSPDSTMIVAGGDDGQINRWDVKTGLLRMTYFGHGGSVNAVAFTPDGSQILSGGADQVIRMFDPEEDQEIRHVDALGVVTSIAVAPDGKSAISCASKAVRVWELNGDKIKLRTALILKGDVRGQPVEFRGLAVAFSGDGKKAAIGDDHGTVHHFDMGKGVELTTFLSPTQSPVFAVAYAQDGTTLAAGSSDRTVRVWDLSSSAVSAWGGHDGPVRAVAFLTDSKRFVSAGDDGAPRMWLARRGTDRGFVGRNKVGGSNAIEVSLDGCSAWSGGGSNPVRQWDIDGMVLFRDLGSASKYVTSIVKTPDGRFLFTGHGNQKVALWDAATGAKLLELQTGKTTASAFDDGDETARPEANQESPSASEARKRRVTCVAISSDASIGIAATGDGVVHVWDLKSKTEILKYQEHSGDVLGVDLSPDGKTAASVGEDQLVRTWNVRTGENIFGVTGHSRTLNSVTFSHDGRLLATASNDTTVRIWDAKGGTLVSKLEGHVSPVKTVAFSPDDKLMASASLDGMLTLWDVKSGQNIRTFTNDGESIRGLQFAPNGESMITVDHAGVVRKWDFTRPMTYRRFAESLPKARETLAKNPQDPEALKTFGEWAFFRGDWNGAAKLLVEARTNGAKPSHLMLARALRKSWNKREAVEEFKKAITAGEAPEGYLKMCVEEAQPAPAK